MFECKNCDGIDINCTDAEERDDGTMVEHLECSGCGAVGWTITPPYPGRTRHVGRIRYV